MKIAQVSPLFESVPPKTYGGTERVVSYLTEELVRLGHEVNLYATADSDTAAALRPQAEQGLRLDPNCADPIPAHLLMLDQVAQHADEYDLIHYHTEYLHFVCGAPPHKSVTTLHGRLDVPDIQRIYRAFRHQSFVSISDAQRAPMPWLAYEATIHHGLPAGLLPFTATPGSPHLAFVGRISPEKGVDSAIEIAGRAGLRLRIAAKVAEADRAYFEHIKPLIERPHVEFVGEITESEKAAFLGDACGLLFPIDWPEPFGLVMVEALACGTPVIAFPHGSVPEVLEDGETGFVVASVEEAVQAVYRLPHISRRRCRDAFDARFSARRMAEDYLAVYRHILREKEGLHEWRTHADRGRTGSLLRPPTLRPAGRPDPRPEARRHLRRLRPSRRRPSL